jgi:hypothetical protein
MSAAPDGASILASSSLCLFYSFFLSFFEGGSVSNCFKSLSQLQWK